MDGAKDLLAAIGRGDVEHARTLLAAEPDLARARDETGVSALLQARYRGRADIADLILAARANPDELDLFEAAALGRAHLVGAHIGIHPRGIADFTPDGFTALHLAAFFGHAETVRLLIERGADVEAVARNPMQVRPLHSATASRDRAAVNALLARGASPNAQQHGGYTPLHAAAMHGDAVMVRAMLAKGADPAVASADGKTAADFATEKGHAEVAALLGRKPA